MKRRGKGVAVRVVRVNCTGDGGCGAAEGSTTCMLASAIHSEMQYLIDSKKCNAPWYAYEDTVHRLSVP